MMLKQIVNTSLFSILIGISLLTVACGQEDKSKRPSPPADAVGKVGNTEIRIDYSQPAVKGRTIWGDLVPYYKVWRTGANEATTFEVNKDVLIEGKLLKAGKYSLFTIPTEEEWTVILNSEPDQWGAYEYEEEKDVLRFQAQAQASEETVERLAFDVTDQGLVTLTWEDLEVNFQVRQATN